METYKVADLMERMTTDIRQFGLGRSTTSFIHSITKQPDGQYLVLADGCEITGDDGLMLSVTPVYRPEDLKGDSDNSDRAYRAGYDYACGYHN